MVKHKGKKGALSRGERSTGNRGENYNFRVGLEYNFCFRFKTLGVLCNDFLVREPTIINMKLFKLSEHGSHYENGKT